MAINNTKPNPILAAAETAQAASPQDVSAALNFGANELGVIPNIAPSFSDKLDDIKKVIQRSNEASNANVSKLEDMSTAQSASFGIIQGAIKEAANATGTIALTKDTAALEAQNRTIDAVTNADTKAIQEQLLIEAGQDASNIEGLEDAINAIHSEEITGISIIDEAINGFRSSSERRKLRRAIKNQVTTDRSLQSLAAGAESINRVNTVTQRTVNEASIAANQNLIAANATIKSTQAELDTLNSNAQTLSRINSANQQQMQNMLTAASLENQQEQRVIQKEKLAHQRKAMEHDIEVWESSGDKTKVQLETSKLRLEQAKKQGPVQQARAEIELVELNKAIRERDATNTSIVERVRKGQAKYGAVAKGTQEAEGTILAAVKRRDPRYLAFMETGSADNVPFGSTPAEAKANFNLVSLTGSVQPTKVTRLLGDLTEAFEAEFTIAKLDANGNPTPLPKRPKKGEETAAEFNRIANQYMAFQAANIKAGDASNPYQVLPMATLLQSSDLQLQPLYTEVLKPIGMKEVIPQTVVDAAVSGVVSKRVTIEEAVAGITSVFELSALINSNQDNGFNSIGLAPQTTYNTVITRPPSFTEQLVLSASPKPLLQDLGLLSIPAGGNFTDARELVNLIEPVTVRHMMVQQLNLRASTTVNNVEGNE